MCHLDLGFKNMFRPKTTHLQYTISNVLMLICYDCRQANRNEEAEEYYRRAAHLKPDVATAHMNLGAMLHFNSKLQQAEESYLMALKLKPDDVVTQNNLKKLRSLMSQKAAKNGNKR